MYRRIIASFTAVVMCFVLVATPASADLSDAVDYVKDSMWRMTLPGYLYGVVSAFLDDGVSPEFASPDDWGKAYKGYTDQMQKDYGATNISSDGTSRYYFGEWTVSFGQKNSTDSNWDYGVFSGMTYSTAVPAFHSAVSGYASAHVIFRSNAFVAPVAGTYNVVFSEADGLLKAYSGGCTCLLEIREGDSNFYYKQKWTDRTEKVLPLLSNAVFSDVVMSAGTSYSIYLQLPCRNESGTVIRWFEYASNPFVSGVQLFPSDSDVISVDSRVGTFSGNFGYYGDGGQMVLVENIQIVNEETNNFYNPVTGETSPILNWTYDYGDRSYTLELEGDISAKVVFGDENVQIVQGGDTYNVYYIIQQGGGEVDPTPPPTEPPGPTDPPGPTETPGPTSPVDPDTPPDTTGWGILNFLKGIFDFLWGLVTKLADVIKNLLMLLFIPKEESIQQVQDEVAAKLPFISDLQDFGDQFSEVLHNPAASARSMKFSTVIDLGNKSGGVSYGDGQANMLDMTWYLDYKPMVDDIIEGVAWLVFLWNLYGAIPNIIHGGASGLHSTSELMKWSDKHDDS